jgi:hypothetical protein
VFDVASGGGTAAAELPDAPGLRLLGFEAALAGSQGAEAVLVEVGAVATVGEAADAGSSADALDADGAVELSATEAERSDPPPPRPTVRTRCPCSSGPRSPRPSRRRRATNWRSAC